MPLGSEPKSIVKNFSHIPESRIKIATNHGLVPSLKIGLIFGLALGLSGCGAEDDGGSESNITEVEVTATQDDAAPEELDESGDLEDLVLDESLNEAPTETDSEADSEADSELAPGEAQSETSGGIDTEALLAEIRALDAAALRDVDAARASDAEDALPSITLMRGLDKITARVTPLEVPAGEEVRFGTLAITARTCRTRPPEETPETFAYIDIIDIKNGGERASVFSGWMLASSPALNPLEHPVYDVWVIDCKIADGEASGSSE